jgi:hypothetical protein
MLETPDDEDDFEEFELLYDDINDRPCIFDPSPEALCDWTEDYNQEIKPMAFFIELVFSTGWRYHLIPIGRWDQNVPQSVPKNPVVDYWTCRYSCGNVVNHPICRN